MSSVHVHGVAQPISELLRLCSFVPARVCALGAVSLVYGGSNVELGCKLLQQMPHMSTASSRHKIVERVKEGKRYKVRGTREGRDTL